MAVCNQKLIDCIKALDTAGYIYIKSPHKCPTGYQTVAPFLKGSLCSKGVVIPLGQISAYTTYLSCVASNGTSSPAPSSMSSYAPAPAPVRSFSSAPAPVRSFSPAPTVSPWILVFSHRTSSAGSQTSQYFANANEAMNIMGDPSTPVHKLSILNTLENYRMNGLFHFKLIYPNLPEPNYIEWTQTNNPTNTSAITDSVIITNPYKGTGCPGWGGGLYNNNNTNTFIQGDSNKGCWFFPVGVYNSSYGGNGYFPGPSGPPVDWVQLYVYYTPQLINNTFPIPSPSPKSSYAPSSMSSYAPAPTISPSPLSSRAPTPAVPVGVYNFTYSGRDITQDGNLNTSAGYFTGTVAQCQLECDKTPNCVGFSRYIGAEDDIVPDTAVDGFVLLKAPFSITNENTGSVPGTLVPDMTYKTWSKIAVLGSAPVPASFSAPAPSTSYAPAPVRSYAPAPSTSYAPIQSTSYAPAPGKLYASVPSNTIVSAPTPIYSSMPVKVPDQVAEPVKVPDQVPKLVKVPDQIQPSSKDINTQVSKDPFINIYKDKLDEDQLGSQPIKYMSDTLANCKLECSKNDQCVGVSRFITDINIPDNNDIIGDCTLLQYPYNLADQGTDSGWTTYTRK